MVPQKAVSRRNRAEQAILFVVDARRKEECVGRSRAAVIPEGERPETIDHHGRAVGLGFLHETEEFMSEAVESSDPSATEIADENGVAECAEIASRPYHTPGGTEPLPLLEVADVLAVGREDFNKT